MQNKNDWINLFWIKYLLSNLINLNVLFYIFNLFKCFLPFWVFVSNFSIVWPVILIELLGFFECIFSRHCIGSMSNFSTMFFTIHHKISGFFSYYEQRIWKWMSCFFNWFIISFWTTLCIFVSSFDSTIYTMRSSLITI